MPKYLIGSSTVIANNLVCRPSKLYETNEQKFYAGIDKQLIKLGIYKECKSKITTTNLKKGITIGDLYFEINVE